MRDKVIVHCSDSNFGNTLLIDKWHKERGFDMVGYHYIILNGVISYKGVYRSFLDGAIESGRKETKRGAHCKGKNDYLGVCLIGKDRFTEDQYTSLVQICFELDIKAEDIFPHSAFSEKTCPNFDLEWWKEQYYL